MSLSIVCVWCGKPLLDVEHAKKHVAEKCDKAPWTPWRLALERIAAIPNGGEASRLARAALGP